MLLALNAGSCGGEDGPRGDVDAGIDASDDAVTNAPPDRPSLVVPRAEAIVREVADLDLMVAGYSDPDGDGWAATEVEVRDVEDGEPTERVWAARIEAPADPLRARLSQGTFEGSHADRARLGWDDPYVARVRHVDARGAASDWSDDVPFRTDLESWDVYDPSRVPTFRLAIPGDSWTALATQRLDGPREYVLGTFAMDGEDTEYCVGIRLKGSIGSFRGLDGKAAFKVKFNHDDCGEQAERFHGLRNLTLNNGVQDQTSLHQTLGYEYFRAADVPAPRANGANVWVNGELWGLYANVESYTPELLEQWFDDASGDLYEGACGDFWDGSEWCFDLDTNEEAPEGTDDLAELIDIVNFAPDETWYDEIREIVDYDRFLTFSAIESILNHWDGYTYAPNNFRIYHDPSTDLFTFIPSGLDQVFLGDIDFWGDGLWGPRPIMGRRCLENPDCRDDFAGRLEEMVTLFEDLDQGRRAQELYDIVAPSVLADPRKEYDRFGFFSAIRGLQDWIEARPKTARAQL
ncbi:MAG: CotH kinase family protein [Deltaproteobacteria bacterium]|nr:CotH kinase family protein [Deltaproteobacteria bacterium]